MLYNYDRSSFWVILEPFGFRRLGTLLCEVPWLLAVVAYSPSLSVAARSVDSQYLLSCSSVHFVCSWCSSSVSSSVVVIVTTVSASSPLRYGIFESFLLLGSH